MILKSRCPLEDYKKIFKHYESCFAKEGDTHKGLDWPNEKDQYTRFFVMTDLFKEVSNPKVLDFGCGLGHYLSFVKKHRKDLNINYIGLDISKQFIDRCKIKFPNENFICIDVLKEELNFNYEFAILNGVFTVKNELSEDSMWEFMSAVLKKVFKTAESGIAFNVMSKNVDWEKENLFHVSMDKLSKFVCENLSRNFIIRNDYGLYEYTVYVYKKPRSFF